MQCLVAQRSAFKLTIGKFTTSPNPIYQMKLYSESASLNVRYEKVLPVTTGLVQEYLDDIEYTYITENDMFELDEAAYSRVKGLSSKEALTVEEQFEEVEDKIKVLTVTTWRGREIRAPRVLQDFF